MSQQPKRNECSCQTCQGYCQHSPGWFAPGEAERAAKLMNLTLPDFFARYLQVDAWVGDDPSFVLRPAAHGQEIGAEAPMDPRGVCVFFENGRCQIHAAKPFECAVTNHDSNHDSHKRAADLWRTPAAQAQIRALLGREPEQPDGSIFDLFWMGLLGIGGFE